MMRSKKVASTKIRPAGEKVEGTKSSFKNDDDKSQKNVDVISIYLSNGSMSSSSKSRLVLKSHNLPRSSTNVVTPIRQSKAITTNNHPFGSDKLRNKMMYNKDRKNSNKPESTLKTKTTMPVSYNEIDNSLFDSERIEGYNKRKQQFCSGREQVLNSIQANLFPNEQDSYSVMYQNQQLMSPSTNDEIERNMLVNESFNPNNMSIEERLNQKYDIRERGNRSEAQMLNNSFRKAIPSTMLNLQLSEGEPIIRSVDRNINKRNNFMVASQEFNSSMTNSLIPASQKKSGSGMYINMKEKLTNANQKVSKLQECNMQLLSENQQLKQYLEKLENEILASREKVNDINEFQQHVIKANEEANFWKDRYDLVNKELEEKNQMIENELKYIDDLKIEMFKTREDLKNKVDTFDRDKEETSNENFILKQNIEKLKHDLLIQQNENINLRSDIDSYKMQTNQLSIALDNKEKAYFELAQQTKDLQYKIDKLKQSVNNGFISPSSSLNFNSTYESPFRNFLPSNSFKSSLNDRYSDLPSTPVNKNESLEKEATAAKSIKINLASNEIGYKSKSKAEKYSSNAVSAALFWDNDPTPEATNAKANDASPYNPKLASSTNYSSDNFEVQKKMEELEFNIKEEKRLNNILKDPPVQYRKAHRLRELREDLKKAQRNIYELNFYLKSKGDSN